MANLNFNKIALGGRLTKDPEIRTTTSGIDVANITLAVSRKKTSSDANPLTDFIDVVAWRQQADLLRRYFHKGSSIFVVGSLQTRKWQDNDGNNRISFEVVSDEIYFVDSKADSKPNESYNPYFPIVSAESGNMSEDDMPF